MNVKTGKGGKVSIEGIEEVEQFTYLGSIMDRTAWWNRCRHQDKNK